MLPVLRISDENEVSTMKRTSDKRGFTLMETIVVVAILVILFALSVTGLAALRKSLRQRELDSKAEILYMAAQNRISELQAAGFEDRYLYADGGTAGVVKLGQIPQDAAQDSTITADTICYVRSNDKNDKTKAAYWLLSADSVDKELWDNNWIIEYDPLSGSIYSVFYSEQPITGGNLANYLQNMRVKQARLNDGARIGYYGGDVTLTYSTNNLEPRIVIENKEKLTATFYCTRPSAYALTFQITVKDGFGKTYTRTVNHDQLTQINSRTFTYTWVMDSLENAKSGFVAQTGLAGGTDIDVTLTVFSEDPMVDKASCTETDNSLFAYRKGSSADTALIAFARHLQNLDKPTSQVSDTVTKAIQITDISFQDDPTDDEDWVSVYKKDTFIPIRNDALTAYNGKSTLGEAEVQSSVYNLHVEADNRDAGLFDHFTGTLSNIYLTGTKIDGGNYVGGLAGRVTNTTIDNCRVYLSQRKGDLTGVAAVNSPEKVQPWLLGNIVGGLVGRTEGNTVITGSLASTVERGTTRSGGLVGIAAGNLSISGSYADAYLLSPITGGLVSGTETGARVDLNNFYAAGYQAAEQMAAGLVAGPMGTAKNGYSACVFTTPEGVKPYSTAVSADTTPANLYYLSSMGTIQNDLNGTVGKTYKALSASSFAGENLGSAFTMSSGDATFPYNLMDQGLTYYTYPRLTGLNHYGDWQAEFEDGALVYYEVYSDGFVGFYGANVATLRNERSLNGTYYVVGDGYALAYRNEPTGLPTITYGNGRTASFTGEILKTYDASTPYYLAPLPVNVVCTDYIDASSPDSFYQKITIGENSYYYNPHFARTVTVNDSKPAAPDTVAVRTARQLYALSRHYGDYAAATAKSTFRQELDIDYGSYQWGNYTNYGTISEQSPIGYVGAKGNAPFAAEYDGGYHSVTGVSFRSETLQTGMFGYVGSSGSIHDLYLVGSGNAVTYGSRTTSIITGSAARLHMGALAGYNAGTIRNCAASGYTMEAYGYLSSTASIGGLVGTNYGTIYNSQVDAPAIRTGNTNSTAYVGGFAGQNHGAITASYAVGALTIREARNSTVILAGFTANNESGVIRRCYSAAALTAAGSAEAYGFAPLGGLTDRAYYLDGGTYSYVGKLYAYNAKENDFAANAAGTAITGQQLRSLILSGFGTAGESVNHPDTSGSYLYPGVVKRSDGTVVHFGNWPYQRDMGTLGVFYWEYEDGGSNSGYHFSYVGTSQGTEISSGNSNDLGLKGSSLCTEHDDGGVVTHFGYGYFYADTNQQSTAIKTAVGFNDGFRAAENAAAGAALKAQMPGYTFVAYETGSNMYLTSDKANGTWQLAYGSGGGAAYYTYTICPFFADSMSLDSIYVDRINRTTNDPKPGTEQNAYQIRSVTQLQYINWNYSQRTSRYSINSSNVGQASNKTFPYLVYNYKTEETAAVKLNWKQSHDLDAYSEMGHDYENNSNSLFTPIGSMYDVESVGKRDANPYAAFFDSSYDGQAYSIKNIEIRSETQCIGLFGVTIGAKLKNVILYSDKGNQIINLPTGRNWYAMGGLVGLAGTRNSTDSYFENCTVSGYKIIDQRSKGYEHLNNDNNNPYTPGWGGGCVGGLVGATNMNITHCTAVTDITLDIGYWIGYKNLRVGGVAGVCRGKVSYCYAGGSIVSTPKKRTHNTNFGQCTSIWAGGIVGGIVLRDGGTLMTLMGQVTDTLYVENCYSTIQMPAWDASTWVMGTYSVASNGEIQQNFKLITNNNVYMTNCYALDSTSVNAEDYKRYKKLGYEPDWSKWNLNAWNGGHDADRAFYIQNDSNMFVNYDYMSGEAFLNQMNSRLTTGQTGFGKVTVTEQGAPIDGKYSFPGNDTQLKGLNYPFPTILTQTGIFGNTVNVHYGRWPKSGIYWAANGADLDLLADRVSVGTETNAQTTVKLYVQSSSLDTSLTPTITFQDENGQELPDSGLSAVSSAYHSTEKCYEITFTGEKEGTVVAKAVLNGAEALLTIRVTAELKLIADPATLTVYEGDETQTVLRLRDSKNKDIDAPEQDVVWEVTVDNGASTRDVVECGEMVRNENGTYTLPVTGFAAGEAAIRVTCTYRYEGDKTVQTSLYLSAATKASDILGLSNGRAFNQTAVPHTPQANGYTGRDTASGPAHEGLYLYATKDYTALSGMIIETVTIRDNALHEFKLEDGEWVTEGYALTVGDVETGDSTYDFRSLTLNSEKSKYIGEVTLSATLRNADDRTYTLNLRFRLPEAAYTVTFDPNGENVTGKMAPMTCTTNEAFTLTQNHFTREGYDFQGWALTADGAVIYADRAEITEDLIQERGENVTLYAVWEKQEENGGDTGNSGEAGDSGEAGGAGNAGENSENP